MLYSHFYLIIREDFHQKRAKLPLADLGLLRDQLKFKPGLNQSKRNPSQSQIQNPRKKNQGLRGHEVVIRVELHLNQIMRVTRRSHLSGEHRELLVKLLVIGKSLEGQGRLLSRFKRSKTKSQKGDF